MGKRQQLARGVSMSRRNSKIGRAGEGVFEHWASELDIECASPKPDEVGVDWVVELPLPQDPIVRVDAQPGVIHAYVQVKASTKNTKSEALKLGTCRNFVSHPLPVFIVMIHLDERLREKAVFVRHVDELLGAEVLAELRRLDREPTPKDEFRVRWSKEHQVELGAKAVFERLRDLVGNAATYASRKKAWRDSVGYGVAPTTMRIAAAPADISAHLLGELKFFRAEVEHASERRFGIEHDIPGLVGPDRLVTIKSIGEATILRFQVGAEWVDVPGRFWSPLKVLRLDEVPEGSCVWRFEAGLLEVRSIGDRVRVSASTEVDREDTLKAWWTSARACELLGRKGCRLSLLIRGRAIVVADVLVDDWNVSRVPGLTCVRTAAQFAVDVGLPFTLDVTTADLMDGHGRREDCVALAADTQVGKVKFTLTAEAARALPKELESVVTAVFWGQLGGKTAVCVASSEPAPFTITSNADGDATFVVPVRTSGALQWVVRGTPREAWEALETLVADVEDRSRSPSILHAVFTKPEDLRRLAEAQDSEVEGGDLAVGLGERHADQ